MVLLAYMHAVTISRDPCQLSLRRVSTVKPGGTATLAPASQCQALGSGLMPTGNGSTSGAQHLCGLGCPCASVLPSLTGRSIVRFWHRLPITSLKGNITIPFSSNFRFILLSLVDLWPLLRLVAVSSLPPGSSDSVPQPLIGEGCDAAADR